MNMRLKFHYLAAAAAVTAPVAAPIAAHAEGQYASVGLDAMVGFVNDDSAATGPDNQATPVLLPSAAYGETFVVQVDAMLADHRDDTVFGGAVHAGLNVGEGGFVGAYGSRTENSRYTGLVTYRAGGEIDFDLGAVGIASVAGYEHTNGGNFYVATTSTQDIYDSYNAGGRFFAFSDLRFNLTPAVRLSVGHRYNGGVHGGAAGAAIGFGRNIVVFAEGRMGQRDNNAGFIGLRARFGGTSGSSSSLLDSRLMEDLFTVSNTRSTLGVAITPPDESGCGSCGGYCEL